MLHCKSFQSGAGSIWIRGGTGLSRGGQVITGSACLTGKTKSSQEGLILHVTSTGI